MISLDNFEIEAYDMEAPFNRPYVAINPDHLTTERKLYLVGKLSTFKGTRDKCGQIFSERQFLSLRFGFQI
jgi:hypothetical protein